MPRIRNISARIPLWIILALWALTTVTFTPSVYASPSVSGDFTVSPTEVTVETKSMFVFDYVVGNKGLNVGDEIGVYDPMFHGMRWGKWGNLTPWPSQCEPMYEGFDGLSSHGLVTAETSTPDVILSISRTGCDEKTFICEIDVHQEAYTSVIVENGALSEGDIIQIRVGDNRVSPDCGLQVGPRAYPHVWWPVYEIINGDRADPPPPEIRIHPHDSVAEFWVVAPSQGVVDEPFQVKIAALDVWGNAVPNAEIEATLSFDALGTGSGQVIDFSEIDAGWMDLPVTFQEEGVFWIAVQSALGTTHANPVEIFSTAPDSSIFFGDIHSHHGYSWYDEAGVLQDINMSYARDVVGLDVASESVKAEPVEFNGPALWEELSQTCAELSADDSFLVLQGFEWMSAWVVENPKDNVGHHNVYYNSCDGPLGDHDQLPTLLGEDGLWAYAKSVRETHGIDALSIPHAMSFTRHYYDSYDNDIQTVAEIFSGWGDSTPGREPDGTGGLDDMFQHDVRMGFIASSDNHDGWMGNPYYLTDLGDKIGAGYVAFVAPRLTRADIFNSLKTRSTYATTANRGILHFEISDSGVRVDMGKEYLANQPTFSWAVYGTGPLAEVTLWAIEMGGTTPSVALSTQKLTTEWSAEGTLTYDWDQKTNMGIWLTVSEQAEEQMWSSPIWLTADCSRMKEGAIDPLYHCSDPPDTGHTETTTTETNEPTDTGVPSEPDEPCGCASTTGPLSSLLTPLILFPILLVRRKNQKLLV